MIHKYNSLSQLLYAYGKKPDETAGKCRISWPVRDVWRTLNFKLILTHGIGFVINRDEGRTRVIRCGGYYGCRI